MNDKERSQEELIKEIDELRRRSELNEQRANILYAIIEAIPYELTIYDKNGNITTVDEFSKNLSSLTPRSLKTALEAPINSALNGKIVENRVLTSTDMAGKETHSSISSAPIRASSREITGALAIHKDISERKQVEQALMEKEARQEKTIEEQTEELKKAYEGLANILESIADPFFTLDREWRFAYINRQAQELYYPDGNLVGKNIWSIFPSLVNSIFWEKYHEVMESKKPLVFEAKTLYPGRWSELIVYPFGDGISVLFRDITERKKAEDVLKLNQQRMEALLELNQMNSNSLRELAGLAYQKALNLTGSDIGFLGFVDEQTTDVDVWYWPGKIMEECQVLRENLLFPLAGAGIWAEALRQNRPIVINDYSAPHPLKRGFPPGHVGLKNLLVVPLNDGNRCVAVMAVANKNSDYDELDVLQLNLLIGGLNKIVRRWKAEEAMRQSEDRFWTFFNTSPTAMVLFWRESGEIIDANPSTERLFKHTRVEMIGKAYQEIGVIVSPLPRANRYGMKIEGSERREVEIRLSDGSRIRTISVITWLKGDEEGQGLASFIDITDLRRMESEIARLDRLNLIGEMAASIGHEIRNPMTAIRGFLQMLGDKDEYSQDRIYFDLMVEEIDRANGIISEYLGMAKNKRVDLQAESLSEIVNSLLPMIQSDANYREMNVRVEISQTPDVNVDVNEIRQLILNIVRNALEAMKPGGTLIIGTLFKNNETVLYIKDQGHGLPGEIQNKIGTPFITTKEKGTGLGLAVCYSIAARHNASIDYQTGQGGTTFYVRFPPPVDHQSSA